MFGLQELFDKQIEQQFLPNILCTRILEGELEDIGLHITDSQRSDFEKQFKNLEKGSITFDFSDKQLKEAGVSSEDELKPKIKTILDKLVPSVEKIVDNIDETMENLTLSTIDQMAKSVNSSLEQRIEDMLEDQEAIYKGFAEDVQKIWGNPLGLLQGLIVIADEAAQGYLTRSDDYSSDDIVQDVLLRIHAKASQVSKEILTLLRNGFADGAQARWRSLHELTVVSFFISHHGEGLALRYIKHDAIEIYKAAIQYNEYYTRLGAEEISQEDIEFMKKDYTNLINEYGDNYRYDYGWAADALNIKKPNFRDIEASVNLDHHRPYYKSASANIHANPSGVFSRLGLLPEEDVLLAGPSNIGLTEPAQSTILSLVQITTSVLTYSTNIDFLVACKAMAEYSKTVEMAFLEVEQDIINT